MRRLLPVLALGGALVASALSAAEAASSLTATTVETSGTSLTVVGGVAGADGRTVTLQYDADGRWTDVATTTSANERYSITTVPLSSRADYRAVVSDSAGAAASTSEVVTFTGRLAFSPEDAVRADDVQVSGRLPGGARDVTLEYRGSGEDWREWGTGRSAEDGRFSLPSSAQTGTFRVTSPAVADTGSSAWDSEPVATAPPRMRGTLRTTSTTYVNEKITFEATVSPVRPGEKFALERQNAYFPQSWDDESSGRVDAQGRVAFDVTLYQRGTYRYRIAQSDNVDPIDTEPLTIEVTDRPPPVDAPATIPTDGVRRIDANTDPKPITPNDSWNDDGTQSYGLGDESTRSADGRWVVMTSDARHLLRDDQNDSADAVIVDTRTGETKALAVDPDGSTTRYGSSSPTISADGRWVAFQTTANFLRHDAPSHRFDSTGVVVLLDRRSGTMREVARTAHSPRLSADGAWIAYATDADDPRSRLWSRATGTDVLIGDSGASARFTPSAAVGALSADGRYSLLQTTAGGGLPGARLHTRLVLWDRVMRKPTIVAQSVRLGMGNSRLSSGGRYVVYSTRAQLGADDDPSVTDGEGSWDTVIWDRTTGRQQTITELTSDAGDESLRAMTPDARFVFLDRPATEQRRDAVVRWDRRSRTSTPVLESRYSDRGGRISVSHDGQTAWFTSNDPDLTQSTSPHVQLFSTSLPPGQATSDHVLRPGAALRGWKKQPVVDRRTSLISGPSLRGSWPAADSFSSDVSRDGRYVAFSTQKSMVEADSGDRPRARSDSDVYLKDRRTGAFTLVSKGPTGSEANEFSQAPQISDDGRFVIFTSYATDLVPGDSEHDDLDAFRWDRTTGRITRLTTDVDPQAAGHFTEQSSSADGRTVALWTTAEVIDESDEPQDQDLYIWEASTQKARRVPLRFPRGYAIECQQPAVSNDGRTAVLRCARDELDGGEDTSWSVHVIDTRRGRVLDITPTDQGDPSRHGLSDPSISADGRYVVFDSAIDDLVPGDRNGRMDVFQWDARTQRTTAISAVGGRTVDGRSSEPQISSDGQTIVYSSSARGPFGADLNARADVIRWQRSTGRGRVVGRERWGGTGSFDVGRAHVSATGRFITFTTENAGYTSADTNRSLDVYLWTAG